MALQLDAVRALLLRHRRFPPHLVLLPLLLLCCPCCCWIQLVRFLYRLYRLLSSHADFVCQPVPLVTWLITEAVALFVLLFAFALLRLRMSAIVSLVASFGAAAGHDSLWPQSPFFASL